MTRSLLLVICGALLASPAVADVTQHKRLVEDTAFTLRKYEWKLGPGQSAFGITDRLQLGTFVLGNVLTFLNGGLKYQLIQEPHLSVAVDVSAGRMMSDAFEIGAGSFHYGGYGAASLIFHPTLLLHLVAEARWVGFRNLDSIDTLRPLNSNVFTPSVRGTLEWIANPRHILFLMMGTPVSWNMTGRRGTCLDASGNFSSCASGTHTFDATYQWSVMAGYQHSRKYFNVRLNAGYGLVVGPLASFDLYWRI